METAPVEVESLLHLAEMEKGVVLDLCCGPGRHSIELARGGYRVTGVDNSPYLLARAQERAGQAGVEVEWVHDSMLTFLRPNAFDLVLNLFTSFGYFEREEDDMRVLQNVRESLRQGGRFVIDVVGKERLARIFQPTVSRELDNGRVLIERHEIIDDWTRISNEWIIKTGDRCESFRFQHRLYSGQELKDRLKTAGFRKVDLYGDLGGSPYGVNSPRLVAVARK